VERGRPLLPRWGIYAALIVLVATFTAVVITLRISQTGFATTEDTALLQERQDCARRVSATRNSALDKMLVSKARVDQLFIAMVVGSFGTDDDPTADQVEALHVSNLDLDERIKVLNELPPNDEEVERHCPSVK
jgi:hypothetical protein